MRPSSGGVNRIRHKLLEGAAGAALVIYPPVGAGLLFIRAVFIRGARPSSTWLIPWAGLLFVGFLVAVYTSSYLLLLQAAVGVLAGWFMFVLHRRAFLLGLLGGLGVVVLLGFAERDRSRALWNDAGTPQSTADLIAGISRVSGDSPGWRRNGIRLFEKHWLLGPDTQQLELSLEMRSLGATSGWQWYTNSPVTQQVRQVESGIPFTRFSGLERYIVRRARSQSSLGGVSVRASLEMRASTPIAPEGCILEIRSFEPSLSTCEPLQLDSVWRAYDIGFTFPASAPNRVFEVIVGALDVDNLDVRGLEVEVFRGGEWVPLGPLAPEGVEIRFPIPGLHQFSQPSLHVVPTPEWQHYKLDFKDGALDSMKEVTGLLQVEAGTTVEIRDVVLRVPTRGQRQPIPLPRPRSSLWFEQANLAGHSFATLGFIALILTPISGANIVGFIAVLLAISAVFLSGSRAAWVGTLLGASWLIWLRSKPPRRKWLVMILIAAVVGVTVTGGYKALGRLQPGNFADGNTVTRTEIWGTAWTGLWDHPLFGTGPKGFSRAWLEQHPDDERGSPTHAHNLWLEFAVSYGLPGFAAILWLTGGLIWLAWHRGRWRGLALIVPVLLMNVFDYTFFFAGVFYPYVLGMNALSPPPERANTRLGDGAECEQ